MADDGEADPSPTRYTQIVTAVSGFAYGVIGADVHVFEGGLPLYLLANWPGDVKADGMWLRELPSRMLKTRAARWSWSTRPRRRTGGHAPVARR